MPKGYVSKTVGTQWLYDPMMTKAMVEAAVGEVAWNISEIKLPVRCSLQETGVALWAGHGAFRICANWR